MLYCMWYRVIWRRYCLTRVAVEAKGSSQLPVLSLSPSQNGFEGNQVYQFACFITILRAY
jgi:hypothetical protein